MPPTFVRGQWTQYGTGTPVSALTVGDGTVKDVHGTVITPGRIVGDWGAGNASLGLREMFAGWCQGGVWDTTHNQFIMGPGNYPNFDLNIFDFATGTWNPTGRLARSFTEFMMAPTDSSDLFAWPSQMVYGGGLDHPAAFSDWQDHYQDIAEVNAATGHALLPCTVMHYQGNGIWMPTINSVVYTQSYGGYRNDQGEANAVWTFSRTTGKWSADLADNLPVPPGQKPIGTSVLDTRRNRIICLRSLNSGQPGYLCTYDPALPQGSRLAFFGAPLNAFSQIYNTYPVMVYDSKRDQVRIYGAWQDAPYVGQGLRLDFSSHGGTAMVPAISGFPLNAFFQSVGLLYDPVADRDVMWLGGTAFTQFANPAITGDPRTLWVIHPETAAVATVTLAGAAPPVPNGGDAGSQLPSIWARFAYLPTYDVYAVVSNVSSDGCAVYAPDRATGPLAAVLARPALLCTDLAQGPRTGNSDTSFGQTTNVDGAYVTVWGQNLGTTPGTLTLGGVAQRIISWGNATGTGVVANLYNQYQHFQMVVFQVVAATPLGAQPLAVTTVDGLTSASFSFTVVSTGAIRFTGQYGSTNALLQALTRGDIGYVQAGYDTPFSCLTPAAAATPGAPIALVGYPGAVVQLGDPNHDAITFGSSGAGYGMVYAKLSCFGTGGGGQALTLQDDCRVVGCKFQAPTGYGSSGTVGLNPFRTANRLAIYANEFTNCGLPSDTSQNQYHVLYISGLRGQGAGSATAEGVREIAWNYLHDNVALDGIHIYNDDQGGGANWIYGHKVHDNVVVKQVGAGIALLRGTVGENWVWNNLLVECGQLNGTGIQMGIWIHTSDPGTEVSGMPMLLHLVNNTILNAGQSASSTTGAFMINPDTLPFTPDMHNNLVYQANGMPYLATQTTMPPAGTAAHWSHNLWFGAGPAPGGDSNAIAADPALRSSTVPYDLHLTAASPAVQAGVNQTALGVAGVDLDTLTRPTSGAWDIGAYQAGGTSGPPPAPPATVALTWIGLVRDRVGGGPNLPTPDGQLDGCFTVTLTVTGGGVITKLRMTNSVQGTWDTDPASMSYLLGAADSLDRPLWNAPDKSVNAAVADGGSFVLFLSDYQALQFVAGVTFTLVATLADSQVLQTSVVIGAVGPPATEHGHRRVAVGAV